MSEATRELSDEFSRKVLVVDDEPALLRALSRVLQAAGWQPTVCPTAAAALKILEHEGFAVVISDVDMPGLSGMELIKLLRGRQLDVPVVLMTGAPMLEGAIQAADTGAFMYLAKPIANKQLLEVIESAALPRSGIQRIYRNERGERLAR